MPHPLVVHVNLAPYDVYIGRRVRNRPDLVPVGWGNPFHIGKDGTREEVMAKFRDWIQTQPQLLERLPELRGKVLGCWCAAKEGLTPTLDGAICHGQILAALANAEE